MPWDGIQVSWWLLRGVDGVWGRVEVESEGLELGVRGESEE